MFAYIFLSTIFFLMLIIYLFHVTFIAYYVIHFNTFYYLKPRTQIITIKMTMHL